MSISTILPDEDALFWLNFTQELGLGEEERLDYVSMLGDDPTAAFGATAAPAAPAASAAVANCSPAQVHRLTDAQLEAIDFVSLYVEKVSLIAVSTAGLVCNSVAIPVLLSSKMTNLFNRTLAMLAVFDNLYLLCDMLDTLRPLSWVHTLLFPHLLYPLQNIALVSSIYTTVLVALERYIAVSRPLNVFVRTEEELRWRKVLLYVGPVLAFSVLFNIPTFFHFYLTYDEEHIHPVFCQFDGSYPVLCISELRRDTKYLLYYINLARIPVTGLIPLASLCLLNYLVYKRLVLRRRKMRTSIASRAQYKQQESLETRQSNTLYGVAALFVAGHLLRVILNLHDLVAHLARQRECGGQERLPDFPAWSLVMKGVSRLMMCLSSSANLLVYCAASAAFRRVLVTHLKRLLRLGCRQRRGGDDWEEANNHSTRDSFLAPHRNSQRRKNLVGNSGGDSKRSMQRNATKTSLVTQNVLTSSDGNVHHVIANGTGEDPDAIVKSEML